LPGVNEEIDLCQGVHKNIITRFEGVNEEIDLSLMGPREHYYLSKGGE